MFFLDGSTIPSNIPSTQNTSLTKGKHYFFMDICKRLLCKNGLKMGFPQNVLHIFHASNARYDRIKQLAAFVS